MKVSDMGFESKRHRIH